MSLFLDSAADAFIDDRYSLITRPRPRGGVFVAWNENGDPEAAVNMVVIDDLYFMFVWTHKSYRCQT